MVIELQSKSRSTSQPLVSALIPTWNGELYLKETIDSALSQSYQNIEVIVVNDGSTDSTEEICKSYGKRIRYFRQEKDDKGGGTAYIRAVNEARGEYIAILDHDDRWLPSKISKQVKAFLENPQAGACFTKFSIIDANGLSKGVSELGGKSGELFHILLEKNRFCHASSMYKPSVLAEVGGINVDIGCGDWDLWLRISRKYPVIMIDEVLTEYRVHAGGYSREPRRMVDALKRVIANQRDRWHTPDCVECRRASKRGMKIANHLYVAHFHTVARTGRSEKLIPAFLTALREAPDAMLAPRNLITSAKSLGLYFRHRVTSHAVSSD